ncbi:MAG: ATP-binding cassette domain-containing protein [Galbitalea sp.]
MTARVRSGEWLVVEGPSGSGKSTLLTVLLDYLAPSAGCYRVDGTDVAGISAESLRAEVTWAPQDGHLFDSTLRANLLLARPRDRRPTDAEMLEALRRVGLAGALDTMPEGLDTRVGAGGSQLSGGQRQRVVIARSLLARGNVVLLDEPTAHPRRGLRAPDDGRPARRPRRSNRRDGHTPRRGCRGQPITA